MRRIIGLSAAFALSVLNVTGQETGSIVGKVQSATGQPLPRTEVVLVETSASVRTNSNGAFTFTGLTPATYNVLIESDRFGSHVRTVDVSAGSPTELIVEIDVGVHAEEIVVSASADIRTTVEVYQPIGVLSEEDLLQQSEASLGETLNKEPGVSSTYFGPGSSRPVVRGLGGDRIRILEDGLGAGDASNVSPDHAVTSEALSAERIEIVRGPATLLYGSAAVGGVVNVLDGSIPNAVPAEKVTGTVDLIAGTVADELTGAVKLDGGEGNFAWHVDYLKRDTDDYEIPGPPEAHDDDHEGEEEHEDGHEEEEEFDGFLENSSLDTETVSVGASWVFDRGYAGIAVEEFQTNYGIPGHAHHHEEGEEEEEEEEEGPVRIDMDQSKIDFESRIRFEGPIEMLKLRAGTTDYEHVELEGDEVGTTFENDSWEARVEAVHRPLGVFNGAFGVQVSRRDFVAIGEEAFVPPSETDTEALFLFEETTLGDWSLQGGARWESQDVKVDAVGLSNRSFEGLSGSIGAIWNRADLPWSVAASLARTERLPTAEELFSNGPHAATQTFEVGNPLLDEEIGLSADVTLRFDVDPLRGEVTVFRTEFSDFVYLQPSEEIEDGLPVNRYRQDDATFTGIEFQGHYELFHREPYHLELEFGGDWVSGELDRGEDLPRITPARLFVGLLYEANRVFGEIEARHVFEQDDVAPAETPTDGFTMLNANIGYRFLVGETAHIVMVRGRNLTDELARNHVSPLKDEVPLPGRDLSLAYRVIF